MNTSITAHHTLTPARFSAFPLVKPTSSKVNFSATAENSLFSGDSVQFSGKNQESSFDYDGKRDVYTLSGDIDLSKINSARLAVILDAGRVQFSKDTTLTGGTLKTNGDIEVSRNTTVTGHLESGKRTTVMGTVIGNIQTDELLTAEKSLIQGDIRLANFNFSKGQVQGNITQVINLKSPLSRVLYLAHTKNIMGKVIFEGGEGIVLFDAGSMPIDTFSVINGTAEKESEFFEVRK